MSQELKLFTLNRDTNPNAQFDIGNWVAFADAAGTAPVDGTGGAPAVTVTRTTSTPLDGVASILFTKDAANRQGQGISKDIVLQPDDATKVFTWSFDYQVTTGTYTGYQASPLFSDLTAWFYDVTNSIMYQMTGYQLDGTVSTTNQYSFQGQVQIPVGCLTGRIILFLGNTGASAFTARINNSSFGRLTRTQGTIETPWIAYTPTGSWVSNTTYSGFWRRSGDSLQATISITLAGAPTSAGLNVTLPTGMTIDTAKFPTNYFASNNFAVGFGSIADASPAVQYSCAVSFNSSTAVRVYSVNSDGTFTQPTTQLTQASPITFASGDIITFQFEVPIVGWGANGTLGQDASTQVIACKYVVGVTNVYFNDTVPINFGTKVYDTFGGVTTAALSWRLYAPVAGVYHVNSTGIDDTGVANIYLYKNGGSEQLLSSAIATGGGDWQYSGAADVYLTAGQYIDLRKVGGTSHLIACAGLTLGDLTTFSCHRVSGPAQVQAPEIITARYSTNAGQSIANNTVTIIDFEDKSYDDHGCVTTGAAWKFTAPRSGKINIFAVATMASNAGWGVGENAYLSVFKNGAEFGRRSNMAQATGTFEMTVSIDDEVDVLAGDFVDVRILQLSGGSIALQSTNVLNYVSLSFVGGVG